MYEVKEDIDICPECGNHRFEKDDMRAESICCVCGCVIDCNMIDTGPDWRDFDTGPDRAHAGPPLSYRAHDKGLYTEIAMGSRDAHGNSIPYRNMTQVRRMRVWQKRMRISNATERNLATALTHIDRVSSVMDLPKNIRESTASTYRKALKKNLIRGRSIEVMVAACLYASCRQCGVPRTLDEVSLATRVDKKSIGRTYRILSRQLRLNLMPTRPEDYIQRFCSELGLKDEVRHKAVELLRTLGDRGSAQGHGPTGSAAAAIYVSCLLCNEKVTQRQLAIVTGVTEVTIRNRYRELLDELGITI